MLAPVPAAEQRGWALLRAGRADVAALSKVRQHTARHMQRLHRMLRLEESVMETDITRCDHYKVIVPMMTWKEHAKRLQSRVLAKGSGGVVGALRALVSTTPGLDRLIIVLTSHF